MQKIPYKGQNKIQKIFCKIFFIIIFQNEPDVQDDDQDRSGFNFSEIKTGEWIHLIWNHYLGKYRGDVPLSSFR